MTILVFIVGLLVGIVLGLGIKKSGVVLKLYDIGYKIGYKKGYYDEVEARHDWRRTAIVR